MKIHLIILAAVLLCTITFSACTSAPKVKRVEASKQIDLSGSWNDIDARTVSNSLIADCVNSERVANFIRQFSAQNGGKLPTVIVGTFRNNTSEHIDTTIISKSMETAIFNSGKLEFVASRDMRQELRDERDDQQIHSSETTASALGNETGANFMLTGAVRMIEDRAGNITVRSYFVSADLTNIETNERLWMGENNEIKKTITRPRASL